MVKIAVIYSSGYDHTEIIANNVAKGAKAEGADVSLYKTENWQDSYFDEIEKLDAIIFGTPTYMGDVSASFKAFMDASSKAWFEGKWKDKIAGGFTNSNSASGDKSNTLSSLVTFACQHKMIWVSTGLVSEAVGDPDAVNRFGFHTGVGTAAANAPAKDGENPPAGDCKTAELYGKRVAFITKKFAS